MRRKAKSALAAIWLTLLGGAAAQAADIATLAPIGFSVDGKVFAFEQYGVQDGSGFPYSEIFFLDTEDDSFLPGSPFKLRLDNESAAISEVREENADHASSLVRQYGLTDHPGHLAAFNPLTELDSDPHKLLYRAFPADPPFGGAYRLNLEEFDQQPPAECQNIVETVKGFRLRLTESDGVSADTLVHEDTDIPRSRNCPLGYRLGGVFTYLVGETEVHIAMVLVLSQGFEGHDGRWIAVPFRP